MTVRHVRADSADPREYIDGANRAFGAWGDQAFFAWAFRDGGELLFIDDHAGRPLSGSGINWRPLRSGERVAMITGSWTVPEARGRGLFAQLLAATLAINRERGVLTLAFVRADNPSARGVAAAGAQMYPTFYCRSLPSKESSSLPAPEVGSEPPRANDFPTSFAYTPAEWRRQYLERPNADIECIGRRGEWSAIVERTADFDRVHAISDEAALPLLAARAHRAGRRLFWFTMRAPGFPCDSSPGFFVVMPPSPFNGWELQNADRM